MCGMRKMIAFGLIMLCVLITGNSAQACYWYFDKTVPFTEVTLSVGQTFPIPYTISASAGFDTSVCPAGSASCPHLGFCSGYVYDVFNSGTSTSVGAYSYIDGPKTFTVGKEIRYDVCGDYQVCNEAQLKYYDDATSETYLTDTACFTAHVPCSGGCTLTPGYWKTHSKYGPARYDDAWALVLLNGEDTPFFNSGKSWYEVLWTTPAGGNAYYILAHAYIAASLNKLNGATSITAVDAAMVWANTFFSTYIPTSTLSKAVKNKATSAASVLDQYNNGITGPGHCTE